MLKNKALNIVLLSLAIIAGIGIFIYGCHILWWTISPWIYVLGAFLAFLGSTIICISAIILLYKRK